MPQVVFRNRLDPDLTAVATARLTVSGDHFVNGSGTRVTLRGLSTQGMSITYGDKANPGTYFPDTYAHYIDRATQTDADGQVWYANCLRLCFERFPCVNPGRLYTVENVPWALNDTISFAAWASATTYQEGDVKTSGGNRYLAVKKRWRADRGEAWNPTRYAIGDVVVHPLSDHMYVCTASSGTAPGDDNWENYPDGTGTGITEDNGPLQYTWDYLGEYGLSGSTAISTLTPITDNGQSWLIDNRVQWRLMSVDYDSPTMEATFAAWQAAVLDPAIQRAVNNGLYVILCEFDFGPAHHPLRTARMLDFWPRMAQSQWGNHPQVLFELWNESETIGSYEGGPGSWASQKPAIQSVIDAIRAHANNVILVPPPFYSAWIGEAMTSPVTGENIGYTYHQYRTQWEAYSANRDQFLTAVATGLPIVMTEWGDNTSEANPDLNWTVSSSQSPALIGLVGQNGTHPIAGWCAWALSRYWTPGLFDDDALTDPNGFGIATRRWLLAERT